MKHRISLLSAALLFLAGAAFAVPNAPAAEAPGFDATTLHGDWSVGAPEALPTGWALDGAMNVDSLRDDAPLRAILIFRVPCGCWGCPPFPGPFPWPGLPFPGGPTIFFPFPPSCPTIPIF